MRKRWVDNAMDVEGKKEDDVGTEMQIKRVRRNKEQRVKEQNLKICDRR